MITIYGILLVALVIGIVSLMLLLVGRLLRSEKTRWSTKAAVCVAGTILVLWAVNYALHLRRTPRAQSIEDVLEASDAARQLAIRAVRMAAPAYVSGVGTIEKTYTSPLAVEVANNSDQELYLGLDYYADSGSIGRYSPGATQDAQILPVPAHWTGELQFPLRHPRFVAGGYVKIMLAKCKVATAQGVSLPPHSEQLLEKNYAMVSREQRTR